ncbi:uncharacterized protein C11orf16 homolog [Oryctolagus cuniculus]|uniref:uncharacterized protein C11orf16 homolog n=1 Tax=Oryctolagus cuniculus TaxID=9986 RepID=UPI003879A1AF
MDSAGPGAPLPKYCSVATALKAPGWDCAAPPWDLALACPWALRAPWLSRHNPLSRCASYHSCIHIADPAWQGSGWLGRAGDAADTRVLARREPDGFYYWAQIKAAPELEQQGTLLVEFEVPLVTGPKLPAPQLSVVSEEDVIQLPRSVDYSLRTGDKVLAPWEPDRQRYGPGTVLLGLEMTDCMRASEEEEITVHFWNGLTAKVPQGGVRWVPPAVWRKAVERLHKPVPREHLRPLLWAPCCSLLGPVAGCITSGLPAGTQFLCPPCHPRACCPLLCQGCLCCSPLGGPTWWPVTRTSKVSGRELAESELKSTGQLLPLEGSTEKAAAVQAPVAVSSSSSSSSSSTEEEDLDTDLDRGLPQTLTVNRAVHTEPVFLEKSRKQAALGQPEWRYWRRNGPEPRPGKPGTRSCTIRKEEKDTKQEKVPTAVMGTATELALRASNVKLPQTLPEEAGRRRPSTGTYHRDKNSP